jgi:hypothetical protein
MFWLVSTKDIEKIEERGNLFGVWGLWLKRVERGVQNPSHEVFMGITSIEKSTAIIQKFYKHSPRF